MSHADPSSTSTTTDYSDADFADASNDAGRDIDIGDSYDTGPIYNAEVKAQANFLAEALYRQEYNDFMAKAVKTHELLRQRWIKSHGSAEGFDAPMEPEEEAADDSAYTSVLEAAYGKTLKSGKTITRSVPQPRAPFKPRRIGPHVIKTTSFNLGGPEPAVPRISFTTLRQQVRAQPGNETLRVAYWTARELELKELKTFVKASTQFCERFIKANKSRQGYRNFEVTPPSSVERLRQVRCEGRNRSRDWYANYDNPKPSAYSKNKKKRHLHQSVSWTDDYSNKRPRRHASSKSSADATQRTPSSQTRSAGSRGEEAPDRRRCRQARSSQAPRHGSRRAKR